MKGSGENAGGFGALPLSVRNLTLEFRDFVLYYSFARRGVAPHDANLLIPACQFLPGHSDDKYSY